MVTIADANVKVCHTCTRYELFTSEYHVIASLSNNLTVLIFCPDTWLLTEQLSAENWICACHVDIRMAWHRSSVRILSRTESYLPYRIIVARWCAVCTTTLAQLLKCSRWKQWTNFLLPVSSSRLIRSSCFLQAFRCVNSSISSKYKHSISSLETKRDSLGTAQALPSAVSSTEQQIYAGQDGLPEKLGDLPLRLIIIGHNPSDHAWKSGESQS